VWVPDQRLPIGAIRHVVGRGLPLKLTYVLWDDTEINAERHVVKVYSLYSCRIMIFKRGGFESVAGLRRYAPDANVGRNLSHTDGDQKSVGEDSQCSSGAENKFIRSSPPNTERSINNTS
jgi:hypothetical protein